MNNELEKIWRFPGNNYTQDQGIDTPDMETFAQDPIASLARETCQNSIDARIEGKTAKIQSGYAAQNDQVLRCGPAALPVADGRHGYAPPPVFLPSGNIRFLFSQPMV